MSEEIDFSRVRITEEGRKLLDNGLKGCPFCKKQPQVDIQVGTGRCCIRCDSSILRHYTNCGDMDTYGKNMEKAVKKWNRHVDKVHRKQDKEKTKVDKYRWERIK